MNIISFKEFAINENCDIKRQTADEIVKVFPNRDDVKKQAYDLVTRNKSKNTAIINARRNQSR